MEDGRLTGLDVPVLGVIATVHEDRIVGHLGPDLCGPELPDLDDVLDRLAEVPDEPLSGALLDQRNVAGFGNVYAVELPFVVGVSPSQPVGTVSGLAGLLGLGTAVIRTNARAWPAEHDRSQAAARRPLDLPAAGPPLPGVRHDPRRLGGARQSVAAGDHLVPDVSAPRGHPDGRPRPSPPPPCPPPGPPRTDLAPLRRREADAQSGGPATGGRRDGRGGHGR